MIDAYIGLGSNLLEPHQQLCLAVTALEQLPDTELVAVSPVYKTAPVGPPQPHYLNAVAAIKTTLTPETLLDKLQHQEQQQGRERKQHWGPRTLDLDILLYGDQYIDTSRLSIPHPHLKVRAFVLQPLCDIAAHLHMPGGESIAQLAAGCDSSGLERTPLLLHKSQKEASNA